jgi:hypothetical protein
VEKVNDEVKQVSGYCPFPNACCGFGPVQCLAKLPSSGPSTVPTESDDWPDPPANSTWEKLKVYAETRFIADALRMDLEMFIGPQKHTQQTWDRAVALQHAMHLELEQERRQYYDGK